MYFALRLVNMVIGIVWGFGLTWVLVRTLGLDGMSQYVFAAALGLYLSASNLGVSTLLYALLRQTYLTLPSGTKMDADIGIILAATLTLFGAVSAIATAIYAAIILLPVVDGERLALVLFFAGVAVQLPWTVVKSGLEATSNHIWFEALDALRRISQLLSLAVIVTGVPPLVVFAFHLVVWLFVFLAGFHLLLRAIYVPTWRPSFAGMRLLLDFVRPKMRSTILFSLSELLFYNSAYLFIPLLYLSPSALVIYDVFNKFFRAAMNANIVLSTSSMPQLTEAWHRDDMLSFRRGFRRLLGLSLGAMVAFSGLLLVNGNAIVDRLLAGQAQVPATLITAICIAAVANAFQNTSGSVIMGLGLVREAWRLALLMLCLLGGLIAATWGFGLSFSILLLGFAVIYACGSLIWTATAFKLWRHAASHRGAAA